MKKEMIEMTSQITIHATSCTIQEVIISGA